MLREKFGALCEEAVVLGVGGRGENRPCCDASPRVTEGLRLMLELARRLSARRLPDMSIEFLADLRPSDTTGDSGGFDDLCGELDLKPIKPNAEEMLDLARRCMPESMLVLAGLRGSSTMTLVLG